jgi:deoxyribodipyrimidine photo-lyase
MVPELRVREVNGGEVRDGGRYVLYWMIAERRTRFNFGLDQALSWCRELGLPLLVFEPLRAGYDHASDRIHQFVIDGMQANGHRLAATPGIRYLPYLEPAPGKGRGLLEHLAAAAAVVVTDDRPAFFLPRMVTAAGKKLAVRLQAVDGSGLLPLRATDRIFTVAHSFRRYLHAELLPHLFETPAADPLMGLALPKAPVLDPQIARRWPSADPKDLGKLPIEHAVAPVETRGGEAEAERRLTRFLAERIERYGERNQPDAKVTSELSPHLHFGHVSPHEIFDRIVAAEGWNPERVNPDAKGKREGYWGVSSGAEGFLDQLITWRELGFCAAHRQKDHDRYETLPEWALRTLADHENDPRDDLYTLPEFEAAKTHDPIWNAAQRQLLREGTIQNYLRMLWGKKILHWAVNPREALRIMLTLNDRYALDGRDPNSVSGIFWCLGRYDRAWGPERPIFGKVRYMTSESTRRKLDLRRYLAHFD